MKEENKLLLSVVIPVYNTEHYLKKCLDSIRDQTYRNIEIIVVDDGSGDGSGKICDEYAEKDTRIQVLHQTNKGLLAARLAGIEKANGDYVTFVDSDDWISNEMYSNLLAILEDNEIDVVVSGMYRYWSENKIIQNPPFLKGKVYGPKDIEKQILPVMLWNLERGCQELDPSLCSKIFKRELLKKYLEKVQELGIYLGEDTSVIYPMMLEVNTVAVVQDCYYYHRQKEEGIIASYFTDELYFEKLFILYTYLKETFQQNHYKNVLLKQLDYFYVRFMQLRHESYLQIQELSDYFFPCEEIPLGSKVILYGAGRVGTEYKKQNDKYQFCEIILWVDKRYYELNKHQNIDSPEAVKNYEYDYIIIAVYNPERAKEIKTELLRRKIQQEKIIWVGRKKYKFLY